MGSCSLPFLPTQLCFSGVGSNWHFFFCLIKLFRRKLVKQLHLRGESCNEQKAVGVANIKRGILLLFGCRRVIFSKLLLLEWPQAFSNSISESAFSCLNVSTLGFTIWGGGESHHEETFSVSFLKTDHEFTLKWFWGHSDDPSEHHAILQKNKAKQKNPLCKSSPDYQLKGNDFFFLSHHRWRPKKKKKIHRKNSIN